MRRSKLRNGILVAVALLAVVVTVRLFDLSRVRQTNRQSGSVPSMATPSATTVPQPVENSNTLSFAGWRQQLGTTPMTSAQLDEGKRFAEARRAAMLQLMRENPLRALEQSLKWDEWAALPAETRALVEEPFSQTVEFSMVPDCRPVDARSTPWQTHRVKMNGEWFDAFVFGRRVNMNAKNGLPVQGIRLGNQVALWDGAVLPLEGNELAAAQKILPMATNARAPSSRASRSMVRPRRRSSAAKFIISRMRLSCTK
jgi:hypothetical protein